MYIIKRSGTQAVFDIEKIKNAIRRCKDEAWSKNIPVPSEDEVDRIANEVATKCESLGRAAAVEEIQDIVEDTLIDHGFGRMMKLYADYRSERALRRAGNTIDAELESLLSRSNEELIQENANKNPEINSTLRDYMAGVVSKDFCRRKIFDPDLIAAHDEGIIHIHDLDYVAMPEHNCCLINLKDMFENGTVINKTLIETPHSFATACNIATQVVAQVASGQYGGQTFTLAHLSPFIDTSRKRIKKEVEEENTKFNLNANEEQIDSIVKSRLASEIRRGVQTMQYQINTLLTSNGQTPFVSVNMDIHEQPEGQPREDLAMLIEEVLNQRIEGVKNEVGVWISPAFPKLLYFLNADNAYEGSKYFYLTKLAAKCTAKRMVPDYMSEKVMNKLKGGDHYPTMGCRSILTPDPENHQYYGRLTNVA